MIIDEKELTPIKGKELKEGYTFYIKHIVFVKDAEGNDTNKVDYIDFERCVAEPNWQANRGHLAQYSQWLTKLSAAGRLFRRRDKAWKDFSNLDLS